MATGEQFSTVGEGLLVLAPAKVNLSLLVAGKRPDGYHNIETIMAKVNWYDEILIEPAQTGGIEFICKGPCWSPAGEENLVHRAARLFLDEVGRRANLRITLTKNVPAGAGLGSGSSDAAATLLGLNRYLDVNLANRQLTKMAAQLGSDVAFFLDGPLAFCTGRGEKVKKIRRRFEFSAVLFLPDISVLTKRVYAHYRHDAAAYKALHDKISTHIEKNRIDLVAGLCANMLRESCFQLHRELEELKAEIESLGVEPVCLSGSGSAMFCIITNNNKEGVREYRRRIEANFHCRSIIVSNNRW